MKNVTLALIEIFQRGAIRFTKYLFFDPPPGKILYPRLMETLVVNYQGMEIPSCLVYGKLETLVVCMETLVVWCMETLVVWCMETLVVLCVETLVVCMETLVI